MRPGTLRCFACFALIAGLSCGDSSTADNDEVTTEHCEYQAVLTTAGAGGAVTAGALTAGAAEAILEIPVGTSLGAFTARAGFLGTSGTVDLRDGPISGSFNDSIGVETAPRIKVVALSAGGESVLLVKIDLGLVYEGMLFDIEQRLGAEYSGKVLLTASHSHSAWGQQTGSGIYKVGLGEFRDLVYQRYLDQIESVALEAVGLRRAAKLGYFVDTNFDPDNRVSRDRRGENNDLMGGPRKDDQLSIIRIDGTDDVPIAVMPVYGVHGTINDADNSFASTDVTGAVERLWEERFDTPVVVMHLQGAGADTSPTPGGGFDCGLRPGGDDDPCFDWLRAEGNARNALPILEAGWVAAGAVMETDLEIEMLTRSVELGPLPETFTIRDGALAYAPFEKDRVADGIVFDQNGEIVSPIDEFNAPVGAALCEEDYPIFPAGLMPGTDGMAPYGGCVRLDTANEILGQLLELELDTDATHPVCQSTRTTVSALRVGDILLGTIPGELSVLLADYLRTRSPVAPENTVLVGYSQGHTGYTMSPEDWLQAGFESSINVWGPLEGEYLSERLVELMPLAFTAEREDASSGGTDRVSTPPVVDSIAIDDPAPMAGTVPATVPEPVWLRTGTPPAAQPPATISRVSGNATFVWIGDDPAVATPIVTLQREVSRGTFADITRRSGRVVRDGDLLLMYTPLPVKRDGDQPQTHYWAAEWQAVPWIGAVDDGRDLDTLASRAGVPLGRYRFRVRGKSFDITSDAFEVVPATLSLLAADGGATIGVTVQLDAPKSYRVLDLASASNRPVPVRGATFDVVVTTTGGTQPAVELTADADGVLAVPTGGATVTGIAVTDEFGNQGTIAP